MALWSHSESCRIGTGAVSSLFTTITMTVPGFQTSTTDADDDYELRHRAIVDGDLYAQYELARLEEEKHEAEAERAYWAEEERRRESQVCTQTRASQLPNTHLRPVGRERRVACNHRRRGSHRTGSSSRAGPSDDSDLPPRQLAEATAARSERRAVR